MTTEMNISYAYVPADAFLMFVNTAMNLIDAIKTPSSEWSEK